MFLISLGSCDVVLGIQWLSTLGTIKWNFKHLTMEFKFQGQNHILRGLRGKNVKIIKEAQLHKAMHSAAHLCMLQLLPRKIHSDDSLMTEVNLQVNILNCETTLSSIEEVAEDYKALFQEPQGLPPYRGVFDHKIPLKLEPVQ